MEELKYNKILNREEKANNIKEILNNFELNKNNLLFKKGIYVYGDPGSGKSSFVINILKELDYDIIKYDAGDIRNKSIIDNFTKHNMSDKNVLSLFNKKVRRIAIIMDEIDGMNNGDKGGINTLNPIICIGNYHIDKKIKELMKVCNIIELKTPNHTQVSTIIKTTIPDIEEPLKNKLINYIQGDLRKLNCIFDIYKNNKDILKTNLLDNIFQLKSYNDDTKKTTNKLINNYYPINEHLTIMNETDRTIVGLLWHENIIDVLSKHDKSISISFYLKQLENICFADYIDRITFQKQIWQFNEMSSLIKTFNNNKIYHEYFKKKPKYNPVEVRFTKVLTKYSTEYNNSLFIQNLCQQLGFDKKDLFAFFYDIKNKYDDNNILNIFENYEISKLDINRIYRYLEKYIKEEAGDENEDKEVDEQSDED